MLQQVEMIICGDDCAIYSTNKAVGRRGLVGSLFLMKVIIFFKALPKSYFIVIVHLKAAGALSERGDPIDSMIHVLEEMKSSIGTIGVSLTSCSVPGILIEMFN